MKNFVLNSLLGVLLILTNPAFAQGLKSSATLTPSPSAGNGTPTARSAKTQNADSIAAVVNNEVITQRELQQRMRIVEQRMKSQGIALPPAAELEKQLLERMIVDRAQMQLARETGIKIDDRTLDTVMARMAEQNKMTLPELRGQIERDGMTYSQFRDEIRDDVIQQRLREREVDNKIQITESEVDNYLAAENGQPQDHPQQEINLGQILIRIPESASAEQIAERRKRADDIVRQLKSGADFATLAATYSDAVDALRGGELGWRGENRVPQLFLDAVAGLQPGVVAPIVKSPNGFHILKLIGKRAGSAPKTEANAAAAIQQTHARHILIKTNQVMTAAEARRKLTELKERLTNKAATFEELAKLFSNDLSASKGGDLGWIYPGDTVPEFERAMNALKPGEISEPIESQFGYHLIQVLERKTSDVSKERQRLVARQAIRERKLEEATQDWLRQLRDRAYVEYRTEEK